MNQFNMSLVLGYSDIFQEPLPADFSDEKANLSAFLGELPTNVIRKIASHFMGYFEASRSKYNRNAQSFIQNYFQFTSKEVGIPIINRVKQLTKQSSVPLTITSTITSLALLNWAMELANNKADDGTDQQKALVEINVLKVYLYLNELTTSKQKKVLNHFSKFKKNGNFERALFTISLPEFEFHNSVPTISFFSQLQKALWLFEILNTDTHYEPLLKGLLDRHGLKSLNEIYLFFFWLSSNYFLRENEGSISISIGKGKEYDYNTTKGLFEFFSNNLSSFNDDYLKLRASPLYVESNDTYRVAAPPFVVDKIYKSWFFELKSINEHKEYCIEDPVNFKAYYGKRITEELILTKALETLFRKADLKLNSKQLIDDKGKDIKGAPDFYVRHGKSILWFESKDTYIRGDIKMSYDYDKIESDLKLKLRTSGISQLIKAIKKIKSKQLEFDSLNEYSEYDIYPILVLHDESFNTPYLNRIINDWFQEDLIALQKERLSRTGVHSVTIVTIDCLISLRKLFSYKGNGLQKLLRKYEIHCLERRSRKAPPYSFYNYAENFAQKRKLKTYLSASEIEVAAETLLFEVK